MILESIARQPIYSKKWNLSVLQFTIGPSVQIEIITVGLIDEPYSKKVFHLKLKA